MAGNAPIQNKFEVQRKHIEDNLSTLVERTKLYPLTIAIFLEKRVLSNADVSDLEGCPSDHKRNAMFFTTIKDRNEFYETLIEAMERTSQTGVLELLNKIVPSPTAGASTGSGPAPGQQSGRQGRTLVVGTPACTITSVSSTLTQDEYLNDLVDTWGSIARDLGIPNHQIVKYRRNLSLALLSMHDTIYEILEVWVARTGRAATLEKLIEVLRKNKMINCAEALEDAFPC